MENASKALIIAGGVLIAIMVVSIALFLLASARGFADTQNEKAEASAIESFNRYYQSFDSSILGIDALNIYNKAINDIANGHDINISGITVSIDALDSQATNDSLDSSLLQTYYYYSATDNDRDGYIDTIVIN